MGPQTSTRRTISAKTGWIIIGSVLAFFIGIGVLVAPSSNANKTNSGTPKNEHPDGRLSTSSDAKAREERAHQAGILAGKILTSLIEKNPKIEPEDLVKELFKIEPDPYVRAHALVRYKQAMLKTDDRIHAIYFHWASAFILSLPDSPLKTNMTNAIVRDVLSDKADGNQETKEQYRSWTDTPEKIIQKEVSFDGNISYVTNAQSFTAFLAEHPSSDPKDPYKKTAITSSMN